MKVYHGAIICCDEENTVAKYLAEDGGKIVYVGDELPARFSAWQRVELGDRALIPSFADTHIHFASFATFHAGLNVMDPRYATYLSCRYKGKIHNRLWCFALFRRGGEARKP